MRKALAVARWEYVEKIKSKAFIISLLLTPTIMVGVGVLPGLLASRPDTETRTIGVIDRSGEVAGPLAKLVDERFKLPDGQPNYLLRPLESGGELIAQKKEADSLVLSEKIEGYIVIGNARSGDSTVEYHSENPGNFKIIDRFTTSIHDVMVARRLSGLDPAVIKEITAPVELKVIRLSRSGKEQEAAIQQVFLTSYGFMMMMFFLIVTSGQILVRSMLEEKANRVVEVLMSSCSANQLMAGKVIGLSLLGLTQMSLWAILGVAISLKFAVTLVSIPSALLLAVYFVLGYLLYAAIFVAAGAPVSTEQEAQQVNSYLVILLMVPIALAFVVIENPQASLARILTFIPFLTPSMMAMRIPIQMPPLWEISATLILLLGAAIGAIWAAGKIFRTTILVYGKRPSLKELFTLIRS